MQNELNVGLVSNPSAESERGFCDKLFNFFCLFDIFSFLPVPTAREVSTKRSIIGSLVLICIFLAYILTTFILFLTNNIPRTNQYFIPLQDSEIAPSQRFAITFATNENLNESFYNEKYFNFSLQQVSIYKNLSIPRNYSYVPLILCDKNTSDWMGNPNYTDIFCPDPNYSLELQGLLYSSEVHRYPRIVVSLCNNESRNNSCENIDKILRVLETGRIFLFFEKPSSENFATGNESPGGFNLFFYFLVPGSYNRAELYVRKNNYVIKPDYLTSFTTDRYTSYENTEEKYYVSKTPNASLLFLVWFRLDQNVQFTEVVYITIIDQISLWGALWGVLFAIFAIYFVKKNKKDFYKKKPEWNEFDEEIERIKEKNLKKSRISQQEEKKD